MALPRSKSLSISQLMVKVKTNIKRYRTEQARQHFTIQTASNLPLSPTTILKMTDPKEPEYTTRLLDQEPSSLEICPSHPEYMIIGTYNLVKSASETSYAGQARRGSLRVTTVHAGFTPKYAGMLAPVLDRVDLACAVLDVKFHPVDQTLLGVATSNARVYFYRFVVYGDVLGRRVITKLLPLGNVRVAGDDEHGLTPLITQFTWLNGTRAHGIKGVDDMFDVGVAVVTSFGETKIVWTSVSAVKDIFDERVEKGLEGLVVREEDVVHKHDLEAWTVAIVNVSTQEDAGDVNASRLILSGGDDSALIASTTKAASPSNSPSGDPFDTRSLSVTPVWRDRRTHTAGVVAILPLESSPNTYGSPKGQAIPILTGSYDETIRLFELSAPTYRAKLRTELRLNGGVWRLKQLDQYTTADIGGGCHFHYSILVSLMHAGAAIVRVTYTAPSPPSEGGSGEGTWSIVLVTTFLGPHESMVYACDARLENGFGGEELGDKDTEARAPATRSVKAEAPVYTIVSTSFYDMKICTWRFVDEFKS